MPKIINSYTDGPFIESYRNLYCRWKFGKPKHNYYVRNRRADTITLDQYDQYILSNLVPGRTITYDTAGYYLHDVIQDLAVVELDPIVLNWYPTAQIDTGTDSVAHLYGTASNFIVNNTIPLRWKTFDDYTRYWLHQRRFFQQPTDIFFSFRDIFVFHNRLKYHFSHLLNTWLETMEQHGFELIRLKHDLIKIDSHMTVLESMPEISDMVNGNVKIHWRYK